MEPPVRCGGYELPVRASAPNGQILSYPVITSGSFAHHDSIKNLLGEQYELEKANQSLENFVTKDTPPTFVWHTQPDDCVPVENALMLVSALQKNGIKTEFHMFPEGGHGLSLCNEVTSNSDAQFLPHVGKWFDLAAEFLQSL
ncbi:MAG: alpha/beta hydrolase family protein [Hominenteromicrobium sp.]|uniref:alpha/beta hydrolase family protein n=1 Tax=Hominenteromicrobium sp. TaxID=3073581 RepID=UPI00399367F0